MAIRVLVVDDESDTLNLLQTILEISGFEAVTTLNSVDAMTLAEIEKPDVALLDIMMPDLDGFTLCRMMRNHPETTNLPIIFVTAYPALDLEERRVEAGADYVIHKPIDLDLLIDKINELLNRRLETALVQPATTEAQSSPQSPSKTEQTASHSDDKPTKQEAQASDAAAAKTRPHTAEPVATATQELAANDGSFPRSAHARRSDIPKPKKPDIPGGS